MKWREATRLLSAAIVVAAVFYGIVYDEYQRATFAVVVAIWIVLAASDES